MAYPIGYAVTSSITITAGAHSIQPSLRSDWARADKPAFFGFPSVAGAVSSGFQSPSSWPHRPV